jgi:hypothetical protein
MSFCEKEGRRERVKERKTNKKRDACVNNATPHALFTHASYMRFVFDLHNWIEMLFSELINHFS